MWWVSKVRNGLCPTGQEPSCQTASALVRSPELRLAPKDRRYVDPKGPVPGRLMAAKAIVPLQPSDMAHMLFMLSYDPDEKVRAQVKTTVLDDKNKKIFLLALKDESLNEHVLDFFAHELESKADLLELLVLNNTTTDETVAHIVKQAPAALAETISQNQLRLLRTPEILRSLCGNTNASKATVDLACDFAIRSGLVMDDVPAMKEARIRINGPDAPPPAPELEAEAVIEAEGEALKKEDAAPLEEGKRLTLVQKVMKMNVAQKIKLATMGNKEARTLLLRETNKLVAMAAIKSPRITEGEVYLMAASKTCQEDVLRYIYSNRDFTNNYKIKMALIKNPKVPQGITMKWLAVLHDNDIKDLAGDKNVPSAIKMQCKRMIDKKNAPVKVGGGH